MFWKTNCCDVCSRMWLPSEKIKVLLSIRPFLHKAQVLKLSTREDGQNCPDTSMKRKQFSRVLKPKIIWTYKSEPTPQYYLKSQCQSAQIEQRGGFFISTGNNTFWVNSWRCSSIQATVYSYFFTVDQYTEDRNRKVFYFLGFTDTLGNYTHLWAL